MPTRLTFDKLFRISDPKRITRSDDVDGPPMDLDAYKDTVYYTFNFRSHATNTTGLRHRGYVKFFRPRSNVPTPLQHLGCLVDCSCPDYRYRWSWANKQRNSGAVGPNSLNQALNRAPRKTNPRGIPGLCKHILAARGYIYGILSSFSGNEPDTSYKFEKLLTYAKKRWSDFPAAMAAARERTAFLRDRARARNVAGPPAQPQPAVEPDAQPGEPVVPELPPQYDLPELPEPPADELAVAPGKRGRQLPSTPTAPRKQSKLEDPTAPSELPTSKGKVEPGGYETVAQRRAARYGESRHVVNSNSGIVMHKELVEAIRLVEALEDETSQLIAEPDAPDAAGLGNPVDDAVAAPDLPPSEPPISDTALGSDTEGESALELLSQMRDSLQQLATALAPPPEEAMPAEGEMGAGPGGPPSPDAEFGGDEFGVPEPDAGLEGAEGDVAPDGAEGDEDEDEEGESNSRPTEED